MCHLNESYCGSDVAFCLKETQSRFFNRTSIVSVGIKITWVEFMDTTCLVLLPQMTPVCRHALSNDFILLTDSK